MRPCGCGGDRGRHGRSCALGLFKPPAGRARPKARRAADQQPPCGVCPLDVMHLCSDGKLVW